MPVPIRCLDDEVRHFAQRFRELFSKPQYQYCVTVLLGLMLCEGRRTLSGLLQEVGASPSLAGLSRFLSESPWSMEELVAGWLTHFRAEMEGEVAAERARHKSAQPKRRGRPKQPVVTGYVIGDDSTMSKPKGKKMEGLGRHHSTTKEQRIVGHSLLMGLYLLLGRRCPLAPQLYRQQGVCQREAVAFQSKIEQMETLIRTFEPVAGMVTHVLLDSWYCTKCLWRAARDCGFLITTGLKSNRWLRVADETAQQGWRWQNLSGLPRRAERAGLRSDVLAQRRQDGVHACREDLGAQALPLLGRYRAPLAAGATLLGALLGQKSIWNPTRPLCSAISRHAGTLRFSSRMGKKSWAWITLN